MKKGYSAHWKASKQPRKQRKYRYNAPAHVQTKFMSAHLTKSLRDQYKSRSVPLRKGDKVKVLRGTFKGKTGTVDRIDRTKLKVFITGIERTKRDGSKAFYPFKPSSLLIESLDTNDKRRFKTQQPKKEVKKTEVKKEAKAEAQSKRSLDVHPSPETRIAKKQ